MPGFLCLTDVIFGEDSVAINAARCYVSRRKCYVNLSKGSVYSRLRHHRDCHFFMNGRMVISLNLNYTMTKFHCVWNKNEYFIEYFRELFEQPS